MPFTACHCRISFCVVHLPHPQPLLYCADFFYPPLMSSAVERSVKPDVNNLQNLIFVQRVISNAEDIQIIVPAAKFSGEFVNNRCRPDFRKLICGNTHSNPRTANQNTAVYISGTDTPGNHCRNVRIICGLLVIKGWSHLTDEVPSLPQEFCKFDSDRNTMMIAPDSDF